MKEALVNLPIRLKPIIEQKISSKIENPSIAYQENPNQILTIKLAQHLNQTYLNKIPDETPILDLRMNRGKLNNPRKHGGLEEWASTFQELTGIQKQQINTYFLEVSKMGFKNAKAIRDAQPEDIRSISETSKKRILFLKEALKKTVSSASK